MSVIVASQPIIIDPWGTSAQDSGDMVQPIQTQIDGGWPPGYPPRQWANFLEFYETNAIRYYAQRGLTDWQTGELYQIDACVIGDDGNTYKSLQNSNTGNTPSTSPTWWGLWGLTLAQIGAYLSAAPQRTSLGSNVAVSANTQTTILTKSVTFPSIGNTYRVDVRYLVWALIGPNVMNAAVIDTTNSRAFASSGQDSNGTGYVGLAASEVSTQTYAAGSTASFSLEVIANAAVTVEVNAGINPLSPSEATYLEITPIQAS
jgi:hypothetical protein